MKPISTSVPPRSTRWFKPAMIGLGIVFLVSVSFIQRTLNLRRETMGLTRLENPLENAPPVLQLTTVALGAFRGLISNVLWVRLADMQEQDKYFEMVQLADWISKLQPYFPTIWVHLAWNMSYNISVKFNDPKDRWAWVQRGIRLLRDDGLRYNPREPLIYRELAWHFQHKMGQNLDDAHGYYKMKWVEEMTQVLGGGDPNFDELINPPTEEAKERARLLRETYKMDPAFMKKVDAEYGPLEWRLPEAHAIYWAMMGLEESDNLKQDDFIMLRRAIFQSMQLAFHRGRLVFFEPGSSEFDETAPNLRIVARTNQAYEDMIEQEPDKRDHLGTAHKNFLKTAVYFLYAYNQLTDAQQWFDYLRKKYPQALPDGQDLDSYALAKIEEDIGETSHDRVTAALEGMLYQAFTYLAVGEDDRAVGLERFARLIRQRFMNELGEKAEERVGLPELAEMKKVILAGLLDPKTGLPPELANQLRTRLGLPAGSLGPIETPNPAPPASTNTPPSTARSRP